MTPIAGGAHSNVRVGSILLKKSGTKINGITRPAIGSVMSAGGISSWQRGWHRYQFCQLAEVLGGCREKELIARTGGAS